jgi:hypothetical protein
MPRSKPRFNDLKDEMIKVLKRGGDPITDPDEELAKFSTWYLRPGNRQGLDAASTRQTGGITVVALHPFAFPATEDKVFLSTISKRTVTWLGDLSNLRTAANFITSQTVAEKAIKAAGYYPAQAVTRKTSNVADQEISKITGRRYKRKSAQGDDGYVFPFGTNTAGSLTLKVVQTNIKAAIPANWSIHFKPEEYNPVTDQPAFAVAAPQT